MEMNVEFDLCTLSSDPSLKKKCVCLLVSHFLFPLLYTVNTISLEILLGEAFCSCQGNESTMVGQVRGLCCQTMDHKKVQIQRAPYGQKAAQAF